MCTDIPFSECYVDRPGLPGKGGDQARSDGNPRKYKENPANKLNLELPASKNARASHQRSRHERYFRAHHGGLETIRGRSKA